MDEEGLGEVIKTEGEANSTGIGCLCWLLLVVVGVAARILLVVFFTLLIHHLPTRSRRT